MSVTRKVKVNIDLDVMEKVAQKLGRIILRNTSVKLYNGSLEDCELVISGINNDYSIGFKDVGNGIEAVYDSMYEHDYTRILSSYYEEIITEKVEDLFEVTNRSSTADRITLLLRRK